VNEADFVVGQDASLSPPRAVAWSARERIVIPLEELAENTGSVASALNNLAFAVGDSNGRSTYYTVPRV
jgi:hypothetical protein